MAEELLAGVAGGIVAAGREVQILALCVGDRTEGRGLATLVHAHRREVGAKAVLHPDPGGVRQRRAAAEVHRERVLGSDLRAGPRGRGRRFGGRGRVGAPRGAPLERLS